MTSALDQAEALVKAGNPRAALKAIQAALVEAPDDPKALILASIVWRAHGDADAGVEYARRAIAITPDGLPALRTVSVALIDAGLYADALPFVERWLKQAPEDPWAHIRASIVYRHLERLDDALLASRRSIELDPENPEALSQLGNLDLKLRNYSRAATSYRQALAINPTSTLYRFNLALAEYPGRRDPGGSIRRMVEFAAERPEMDIITYTMAFATERILRWIAGILGAGLVAQSAAFLIELTGIAQLNGVSVAICAAILTALAVVLTVVLRRMGPRRFTALRHVLSGARQQQALLVLETGALICTLTAAFSTSAERPFLLGLGVVLMTATIVILKITIDPPSRLW